MKVSGPLCFLIVLIIKDLVMVAEKLFYILIIYFFLHGVLFAEENKTAEKARKKNKTESMDISKKKEQKEINFLDYMEKHKKEYSALYIPADRFIYKKFKLDTGVSWVSAPIQTINSNDKRVLAYPEIMLSIEHWQRRYVGFYFDYFAGFMTSDSENTDSMLYFPTTMDASVKYKIAVEYSQMSPCFILEAGLHYHDLRLRVKEDELYKRIYKGPYIGLERKIPLSEDFGFFFEINYMPYLISSIKNARGFSPKAWVEIHFLASGYMTIRNKKKDSMLYRLKLNAGFSQRDYFTDVKSSVIDKKKLDQRYSSFFLSLSQEL